MIHFLTHPHHRYTQSFDWLKKAIGQEVRMFYGDVATLKEYLPSLSHSAPRLLVLFQLDYLAAWCSQFTKVLCLPMYDLTRTSPDNYLTSLRQVEWISFSSTLHQRLSGLGLSSRYLQYAPDPSDFRKLAGNMVQEDISGNGCRKNLTRKPQASLCLVWLSTGSRYAKWRIPYSV